MFSSISSRTNIDQMVPVNFPSADKARQVHFHSSELACLFVRMSVFVDDRDSNVIHDEGDNRGHNKLLA